VKPNHIAIQTVSTALAVCVSIFAAVFTWQQVEVSRIHNRLSVKPILQITPYGEGATGRNGLYLSNDGLGPAVIKSFSAKVAGVTASGFESDRWAQILSAAGVNPTCFATGWPRSETTLRAGIETPLVYLTKAEGSELCFAELVKLIGGNAIEIDIQYESIYGERKRLSAISKVYSNTLDVLYRKLIGK
jgi:hypothetical protein